MHIEQHQVRTMRAGKLQRGHAVGRRIHLKSMMREAAREHIAIQGLVVHQQQMIICAHCVSPSAPASLRAAVNAWIMPSSAGKSTGLVA